MLKFCLKRKAHHQRQADRHVGIAGEVEIELQHVGDGAEPGFDRCRVGHGEGLVGDRSDGVGDQHLFGEADGEDVEAGGEDRQRMLALDELVGQITEAQDRAGDHVRKRAMKAAKSTKLRVAGVSLR